MGNSLLLKLFISSFVFHLSCNFYPDRIAIKVEPQYGFISLRDSTYFIEKVVLRDRTRSVDALSYHLVLPYEGVSRICLSRSYEQYKRCGSLDSIILNSQFRLYIVAVSAIDGNFADFSLEEYPVGKDTVIETLSNGAR